jgi:hypothetical protein
VKLKKEKLIFDGASAECASAGDASLWNVQITKLDSAAAEPTEFIFKFYKSEYVKISLPIVDAVDIGLR